MRSVPQSPPHPIKLSWPASFTVCLLLSWPPQTLQLRSLPSLMPSVPCICSIPHAQSLPHYPSPAYKLIISFSLCKSEQESLAWPIPPKILVCCPSSPAGVLCLPAQHLFANRKPFLAPDRSSLRPAAAVKVQGIQAGQPDDWGVGAPGPDPDLGCLGPYSCHQG